jgi:hypothetical protein
MPTDSTIQLHDSILDLFHHAISRFPPTHAPDLRALAPDAVGRLGDYLVQLGYLTPRQLVRALRDSAVPAQRHPVPLGCTLVAQDLVSPQVVIAVLLQQFLDRLTIDSRHAPRFLGEQLLVEAQLEPAQLATVLQEQLAAYPSGAWVRVGDLIVHHGWLDPRIITAAAERVPAGRRESAAHYGRLGQGD